MKEGPANDYWDHVDFIVEKANALGLYVGFLPTWGDKWNKKWGVGPEIFTAENAAVYGEWLGRRYRDRGIIWILGGDRPVETEAHKAILRAMARGLRKGDGGAHLMTFHPPGGNGSSTPFHDEDWLDFNMRQNGHVAEFTGRYDQTRADYDRTPAKPVLDGEPIYEDHPVSFDADEARPLDRRRRAPPALLGPLLGAPAATPTATTRSGRCGRRGASRSTTRSCRGSRRSTSPGPARCSTAGASWSRARS